MAKIGSNMRLPLELLERVEAYRDKLSAELGTSVSRNQALEVLIVRALEAVER